MPPKNKVKKKGSEQPLLKAIKDLDHAGVSEADRRLIDQFTITGLDVLTQYYNQKYGQERDIIHHVSTAIIVRNNEISHDAELNKVLENNIIMEAAESLSQKIRKIVENNPNQSGHKIMMTFGQRDGEGSDILLERYHSTPILLTQDKLIVLRDEYSTFGQKLLQSIADNFGVRLVQQPTEHETEESSETKSDEQYSMQADHTSCNGMALGILKDLTREDVAHLSKCEDGYMPLPKMLKYSQSIGYIERYFPQLLDQSVKKDGTTLREYIQRSKGIDSDGVETTRINDKLRSIKEDVLLLPSSKSAAESASKLLAVRQAEHGGRGERK